MTDFNKPGINIDRRKLLMGSAVVGAAGMSILSSSSPALAAEEDTLDKIKSSGTFNLGAREATPPYGNKDQSGEYVGFATDIARAIYDAVNEELGGGIELNYVPVTSQTRIPLLQNGTIDMEAGATVITQGRKKVVDFTIPHFATATSMMVPADSSIASVSDISGKRIGIPQGGLEEAMFSVLNESGSLESPVRTIGFPDHTQGATALQTGSIDAYSSDEPILFGLGGNTDAFRVVPLNLNAATQALLIRQGSNRFRLIADLTIAQLCASGKWHELYDAYFGAGGENIPLTEVASALARMNSWPS
jgi:glutamate/aspartate transport system substrate-binding protein